MKVTFFSILLATTVLFTIQESNAEKFRWVDESGKIRIGIKPPTNPVNVKKNSHAETKKSPQAIIVQPATVKTTAVPMVIKPEIKPERITPIKTPTPTHLPKSDQKNSVKAFTSVRIKTPVTKPITKKATVIQKNPEATIPIKKKTTTKKSTDERNAEMCGVFTDYVHDYEEKVRNCSVNLCDIYKRALTRYQKKQKSYCK